MNGVNERFFVIGSFSVSSELIFPFLLDIYAKTNKQTNNNPTTWCLSLISYFLCLCPYWCWVLNLECFSILLLFILYTTTPLLRCNSIFVFVCLFMCWCPFVKHLHVLPLWPITPCMDPYKHTCMPLCSFLIMCPFYLIRILWNLKCILNVFTSSAFSTAPNHSAFSTVPSHSVFYYFF